MSKEPRSRRAWRSMLKRCHNPEVWNFANYGGRGIRVCERWQSFEKFRADMGECPDGLTLDRIDTDGNYEPQNCRWATRKEQMNNRRCNVRIIFDGENLTATQWAEKTGIHRNTILGRVENGWPPEKVLAAGKLLDLRGLSIGGVANGARNKAKTHCKHGHPFDQANTFVQDYGWGRGCRTCHRLREQERRLKRRS